MKQSGSIPTFSISGTLFGNIARNFIENFFTNILGVYHGNIPRTFHKHIFARWERPPLNLSCLPHFCSSLCLAKFSILLIPLASEGELYSLSILSGNNRHVFQIKLFKVICSRYCYQIQLTRGS